MCVPMHIINVIKLKINSIAEEDSLLAVILTLWNYVEWLAKGTDFLAIFNYFDFSALERRC